MALGAVVVLSMLADAAEGTAPHCENGICYGVCGHDDGPGAHGTGDPQSDNGPCGSFGLVDGSSSAGCCGDPLEVPSTGEDGCACSAAACDGQCGNDVCRDEDCPDEQYCGKSGYCEPCAAVNPAQTATCMRPDADCCSDEFLSLCPSDPAQCSRRGTGYACGTHNDYFDDLTQFAMLLQFAKTVCEGQLGEAPNKGNTVVPGSCFSSDCARLIHGVSESCATLMKDQMYENFAGQLRPCLEMCERDAFANGTIFPITDPRVQAAPITRCGGTITDGVGVHNASLDNLDSVTILAPPGQKVRLNLTSMYLPIGDVLQLFEGNSTDGDPTKELRGTELNSTDRIFTSTGRSLTVRSIHDTTRNAGLGMLFSFRIECICAGDSPGARVVVWDENRALPNGSALYSTPGTTCAVPSPTDFPTALAPNITLLARATNDRFLEGHAEATWGGRPGPYVLAGPKKYAGGVLLLDGRVMLVPHDEDSIGLYDPYHSLFATGPSVGFGKCKYAGGVLLPDGRVVLIPQCPYRGMHKENDQLNGLLYVAIYDPRNETISFKANSDLQYNFNSQGDFQVYCGGVLLPDGRVLAVPSYIPPQSVSEDNVGIGIYDPKTNEFHENFGHTSKTRTSHLYNQYSGGVLMPDGRVLFVPNASSAIGLYDPRTNTFADGPTLSYTGYVGGVLCPDGRVVLVPDTASYIYMFDPVTNTATAAISATGYRGGVLLRDGRVAMVPSTSRGVLMFNPDRYSSTTPVSGCPTEDTTKCSVGAYFGAVVLPNGTVVLAPHEADRIGLFSINISSKAYSVPTVPAPWNALLLPYYNKF